MVLEVLRKGERTTRAAGWKEEEEGRKSGERLGPCTACVRMGVRKEPGGGVSCIGVSMCACVSVAGRPPPCRSLASATATSHDADSPNPSILPVPNSRVIAADSIDAGLLSHGGHRESTQTRAGRLLVRCIAIARAMAASTN